MNDLIVNGKGNLPAEAPSHAVSDQHSTLAGDLMGAAYPKLTFKGNRFRVKIGGEERVLGNTKLPVLILEANEHVSRIYFASAWDGETVARPDCASADGDVPLPTISEPQAKSCSLCPMNEKGSAVTDTGGKTRACSFYKRTVVLLVDEPALGPLVADMKAMSMFGRSYPDQGAFSLRDYAKRLDDNKVAPHAVITELEFDTNESVPKILMRAIDYTSAEFNKQHVVPLMEGDTLKDMVRTDSMNTSADEDDKPSDQGFRDKLVGGEAPDHAAKQGKVEQPEATLEERLQKALADEDYAAAGRYKGMIAARDEKAKPAKKPEPPAEKKVDPKVAHQEACDNMKVDIKLAVEAQDYEGAAKLQGQLQERIEAYIEGGGNNQVTSKPADEKPEGELSPQQKAAITRKKNAAAKKAAAAESAKAAEAELNKEPSGQADVSFDDDLEDALGEFGF